MSRRHVLQRTLAVVFGGAILLAPGAGPAQAATAFRNTSDLAASGGTLTGCGHTQQVASNLWMQKCLIDWGARTTFSAAVVVSVSGPASGTSHYVGVPSNQAVKNRVFYSKGSCLTLHVVPGDHWFCSSPEVDFTPQIDSGQGYSKFDHDGIAGAGTFSPTVIIRH
jgi:hypothetical protein